LLSNVTGPDTQYLMLLYTFLFLIGSEYVGLGNYVPLYRALPLALGLSALVLIAVVSKYNASEAFKYKSVNYTLILVFLTMSAMAHGFVRTEAIEPTKTLVGYLIYTIICIFLISEKKEFRLYILVFTLIHVAMVVINVDKLGAERVGSYKAGFFLGDGNDFAWSLNLTFPLALLLATTTKKILFKYLYFTSAAAIIVGIVGTQSRGATIALAVGLLYYLIFISTKKLAGILLLALIVLGVMLFSPSGYFDRMGTISSYEEDTSAMGRIKAWNTAIEMAVDHPILGVGAGSFNSAYGRIYRKPSDPVRWISTHSIYFKVLAEYGFTGILIFLLIIWHSIKVNISTIKLIKENQNNLIDITTLWPHCLIWSIICWAVNGVFLTGFSYPHLYLLTGISVALNRIVLNEIETADPLAPAPPPKKVRKF
jgi:putative inorganic carbon (hco3(-)) transporter